MNTEEAIKSFEERCRCESRQPETEEEKRRAEIHQRRFEEFYRKYNEKAKENFKNEIDE